MKKLYVGNLPYSYQEEDLKGLFSSFGSLATAKLIIDRDTGRSRGFGFVEISDDGEAQEAIDSMHGKSIDGRELVVNEARPQERRERR